jgi:8-oxo-dGTP pyrophosphatase MutT (NUDIX family)
MKEDSKGNSRSDAKDLLLEDYKALTQALSESEKIGETRVNWFVGIITVVAGAFVALATKNPPISPKVLKYTALGSLVALLVFGLMTLLRIINRNRTTDGFKEDLARIRAIFRNGLDGEAILDNHHPFRRPRRSCRLGGLDCMVAAINSLLAAGIGAVILLHWPRTSMTCATIIAIGAFAAQYFFVIRNYYPWITHAGGVVYRVKDGVKQYLLVGPKKDVPDEWVLPKGHHERHEKICDTALREVAEETGVKARVICPLRTITFQMGNETIRARFYLMEMISRGKRAEEKPRRRDWFSFEDAINRATHAETKALVHQADRVDTGTTGGSEPRLPGH